MITDEETNTLYIADTLSKSYPAFYQDFRKVLKDCGVEPLSLPDTRDVWAVDYMPVQVNLQKFIRFNYRPKYLKTPEELITISDTASICASIGIIASSSDLVIDGGNVIRGPQMVILSDRIFKENPGHSKRQLMKVLEELLEIDQVIFVPEQPGDYTGHADGMIRFLNDDTVLINDYSKENKAFKKAFETAIREAGLHYETIPYNPYSNKNYDQANGCYINYLQMEGLIILPVYSLPEDEIAVRLFEDLFRGQTVKSVHSNEIALQGGVLNCITWNIRV